MVWGTEFYWLASPVSCASTQGGHTRGPWSASSFWPGCTGKSYPYECPAAHTYKPITYSLCTNTKDLSNKKEYYYYYSHIFPSVRRGLRRHWNDATLVSSYACWTASACLPANYWQACMQGYPYYNLPSTTRRLSELIKHDYVRFFSVRMPSRGFQGRILQSPKYLSRIAVPNLSQRTLRYPLVP